MEHNSMTQHPTDEAKKGADDVSLIRKCLTQIESGMGAACIREHAALDRIEAALTDAVVIDAPEGLDKTAETIEQACTYLEKEMEKGFYSPDRAQLQTAIFAARLYAQGRTQGEIDTRQVNLNNLRERLQTCTSIVKKYAPQYCGHHTDYEGDGAVYHETAWQLFNKNGDALIYTVDQIINEYDHISAAPPVSAIPRPTAPPSSAEKDK